MTPAAASTSTSSQVELLVSIDGGNHYFGNSIDMDEKEPFVFSYVVDPTISSVTSEEQTFYGESTMVITGSDFPYDYDSEVFCKFDFSSASDSGTYYILGVL